MLDDRIKQFGEDTRELRVVVVGCGGFIGSHFLDHLLENQWVHVDGWDPDSEKIAHHLNKPNLHIRQNTLTNSGDLEDFKEAARSADAVINLAAICQPALYNVNPIKVIRSNFMDTFQLIDVCAELDKWVIHFSTSEVYGRTIESYLPEADYSNPDLYELEEESTPLVMGPIQNQRWTYACAKQLMERYIYGLHKEMGLAFTIVRPMNFFGPRMDFVPGQDGEGVPRVLASFMTALLNRTPMRLVDGGRSRRTIVSIHDAIRALLLMIANSGRAANQIFNIGNRNNETTIKELAELMRVLYAKCTDDPSYLEHPIVSVSSKEFYGEGYEDCDRRMPNLNKARTLLGWTPHVSLEDTLVEAMNYYRNEYKNASEGIPQASTSI